MVNHVFVVVDETKLKNHQVNHNLYVINTMIYLTSLTRNHVDDVINAIMVKYHDILVN